MTSLIHYSDLHGKLPEIPKKYFGTDVVVVISGDVCNNYLENFTPGLKRGVFFQPTAWNVPWNFRKIDGEKEAIAQNSWIETKLIPHLTKCKIDLNNVLAVNGNHDWCSLDKFFPNSESLRTKNIIFRGIKIGMLVGVNRLDGEWYQEITELGFSNRIKELDPETEILISHSPPHGILDISYGTERIGSTELAQAIFAKTNGQTPYFTRLKLHLFGHTHGSYGSVKHKVDGRVIKFYNAATTRFLLEY